MIIEPLLKARPEISGELSRKDTIVLTTRIRFARNLAEHPFPGWAKADQRKEVLSACLPSILGLSQMKSGLSAEVDDLSELEKQILIERHLISRELMEMKGGAGFVISKDQSNVVMINEEDHLRMQVLLPGFHFRKVMNAINVLDSKVEKCLEYAFSPKLGYLTACPTNLGTGMRASAMMHLPALVMSNQMEKVIRAVNQLGIAVRGLFGEGSDASGSIFQISNQTTLGESEAEIIKRLTSVLNTIIEQEFNARETLLETEPTKLFDKIGRAFALLQNSYLITSSETMNHLSLVRLGVDMGMISEEIRSSVDQLFIDCQPGHIQYLADNKIEPNERDIFRAAYLRSRFENLTKPEFIFKK
ncbi:MAG: protein arginine kinase [Opitutaceae bacterium]|nr:protein arginine kinase [Opitutaceae bacterium]